MLQGGNGVLSFRQRTFFSLDFQPITTIATLVRQSRTVVTRSYGCTVQRHDVMSVERYSHAIAVLVLFCEEPRILARYFSCTYTAALDRGNTIKHKRQFFKIRAEEI